MRYLVCLSLLISTTPGAFAQTAAESVAAKSYPIEYLGKSIPQSFTMDASRLPVLREWQPGDPISEIPRQHWLAAGQKPPSALTPVNAADPRDPLVAKAQQFYATRAQRAFGTPEFSVAGIGNTGVSPPDTTADVGKDHVVQSVNGGGGARYLILNKTDGSVAAGPFTMAALGTGGVCGSSLGDPVIVYDEMAERWLFTEFSTQAGRSLCVYVSAGSNPVSTTWTKYEFQTPAFPDYPHYGVWGNSYLITANEGSTGGNRPIFAVDRAKMLLGQPAGIVRANLPNLSGFGFQTWTPADHDGKLNAVPATLPGIFMRHRDDEAHNAGANNPTQDFLELVQLTVDWSAPTPVGSASAVQQIPMAEFSSNLNGLSAFEAFPQPNGQKIDPLREPIMRRVAYRRFPGYETLLGNLVTDVDGNDTGGIRWFELRRTGGAAGTWTLHQQGTHALADAGGPIDRWMAGAAMDQDGNIALAYSVVRQAPAVFTGLRYAGRLAGDPLGTLTTAEASIFEGAGSQTGQRWGDYAQLGTDPENGCSFFGTGEYVNAGGQWQTRVGRFKFDECGGPTFTAVSSNLSQQICAAVLPASSRQLSLDFSALNGFSAPVSVALNGALPAGLTGTLSAATITPPGTLTANFTFAAGTVAGPNSATIRSQGTGPNGAIVRDLNVAFDVYTQAPTAPSLSAPANAALGVALTPTLSWAAAPQTASYLLELSTSASFTTLIAQQVVTGTSFTAPALASNTQYFWRVSARNACPVINPSELLRDGFEDPSSGSATSSVFSFSTQAGPGDCSAGTTTTVVFNDDMESGAPGWTHSAAAGTDTWAISPAFPAAGANAYRGIGPVSQADQRLVSPAISVPAGSNQRFLSFSQRIGMEPDGANCYDAGILEVSTDAGVTFNQITTGITGVPYTGTVDSGNTALGGRQGWCGLSTAHAITAVDLAPYGGQSVRFRFRLGTDTGVNVADGWNIDNVRVLSCTP